MFFASFLALVNGALMGFKSGNERARGNFYRGPEVPPSGTIPGFLFIYHARRLQASREPCGNYFGVPLYALAGGVIGASFVALNSYIFPKLGATRTTSSL